MPRRLHLVRGFVLLVWGLLAIACGPPDSAQLFEGPFNVVPPAPPELYGAFRYDLQAYADYDSMSFFSTPDPVSQGASRTDPDWVEGAASGILEAALRETHGRTEGDYPSAALYLLSPTTFRERLPSRALQVTYPPDGAAFPPDFCEIRVDWEDEVNDLWQVNIGVGDGEALWTAVTDERQWWFPPEVWREACERAAEGAWIQVKGTRQPADDGSRAAVQASPRIHFRVSRWRADDIIVYRLVVPPFNRRKTPHMYYRDIRSQEEQPFLLSRDNYCFNCHTFTGKSGTSGKLSIQARYMLPGAELPVYLGIYDLDEGRGWRAQLPFEVQMTTFMAWSPDGRYLAFSANQQIVVFAPITYESQFAGEPTSDLAIYDTRENTSYLLPGADHDQRLEILPRWSLDGQRLVYCVADPGRHPAQTRYDLREIPFGDGDGGTSRPVPGASANGRSNYYPRFSPDGRWLSFTQSDGGTLIKPSSDIYLMPADFSAAPRRLESNVDLAADSWHSWSSGGHWLVFASKRDDGIYARLYLTEIDEEGRASPAVRLPLREEPLASYNIPEFVTEPPGVGEEELFEAVRIEGEPRLVDEIVRGG
ncbi:TolB family protein [Candidatus Latescibacterota bacterium]